MKTVGVALSLTLIISGCVSHQDWHCESSFGVIAEACARAQMKVMRAIPQECNYGADGRARISAEKRTGEFTRYRSEAELTCRKPD